MAGRKQNLVLFFKENEEYNVIDSRLVRMYMNRFTIDENDGTEITEVYNIKNGKEEEYGECFSKSFRIQRENKMAKTDTHYITGNETIIARLVPKLNKLIENHNSQSSYLGNCQAITILSGSIEHNFLSENAQKSSWNPFSKVKKFERTINDDFEYLQNRIFGFENDMESIKMSHYQLLHETQVKDLENSISEYNKNLSFIKSFYAHHSMEKHNSNDNCVRFNCKRITVHFNNEAWKNRYRWYIFSIVIIKIMIVTISTSYIATSHPNLIYNIQSYFMTSEFDIETALVFGDFVIFFLYF